ncbi:peptidoglycan amidohydrolase family protein [Jutongia hominis]|uniref:peptidoglycan amidohydrolase family protein n=1 Tax=Jutongia hominis TaxID=2763664 RepID=UPI0038CBF6D4
MHCIFNRGVKNTDKYNEIRNASFSFWVSQRKEKVFYAITQKSFSSSFDCSDVSYFCIVSTNKHKDSKSGRRFI